MTMLASQITSLTVVYSIVYSGVNQRKHQSSASLAFVREIHRGPVNFPHKWPVTRKMFPFDDVIMNKIDPIIFEYELECNGVAPMMLITSSVNVTRGILNLTCMMTSLWRSKRPSSSTYSSLSSLLVVESLLLSLLSIYPKSQTKTFSRHDKCLFRYEMKCISK